MTGISIDKCIGNGTKTQALSFEKKMLTFDFIVCVYTMRVIMYQIKTLTEQLEAIDLNIIDGIVLIECAIKSLSEIYNDTNQLDKHIYVSTAKEFAIKMKIDPISDFEKHHRERMKLRRIDSNSFSQVNFSFCRKEFIEMLDTLITLMSTILKCCLQFNRCIMSHRFQ